MNAKINECLHFLEYIITSISRNLEVSVQQTLSLLAENNKYFSLVLIKGLKGSYGNIYKWLQELYNNREIISSFLKNSEEETKTFF